MQYFDITTHTHTSLFLPFAANNIEEIRKQGAIIAKEMGFPENVVVVGFVPDVFHFVVETCGSLSPSDILESAFTVMLEKLRRASDAVREVG